MKAGAVTPGQKNSARLVEMEAPVISSGQAWNRNGMAGYQGKSLDGLHWTGLGMHFILLRIISRW